MALKIDTDSLKSIHNILVDSQFIYPVGLQVFNNLGTESEEFKELCVALEEACDKVIFEAQKLKAKIPVIN